MKRLIFFLVAALSGVCFSNWSDVIAEAMLPSALIGNPPVPMPQGLRVLYGLLFGVFIALCMTFTLEALLRLRTIWRKSDEAK